MKLLYDVTAFFQGTLDLQMRERVLTPEELTGIERVIREGLTKQLGIADISIRGVIITNIRPKPKQVRN